MKKFSTHCMNDMNNKEIRKEEIVSTPKKQTLDFIRQFAKVYYSEKMIRTDLCGFVLN